MSIVLSMAQYFRRIVSRSYPWKILWHAKLLQILTRVPKWIMREFHCQRVAGSRSITINVNEPGITGALPVPETGAGPNFAETINTR